MKIVFKNNAIRINFSNIEIGRIEYIFVSFFHKIRQHFFIIVPRPKYTFRIFKFAGQNKLKCGRVIKEMAPEHRPSQQISWQIFIQEQ